MKLAIGSWTLLSFTAMILLWAGLGLPGPARADKGMTEKRKIPDAPAEYQSMTNPFTSERDLKYGERQYKSKCSDCHGDEGEGDPDEPEVVKFNDKAYMAKRSDGQLFYIIKFGAGEDAEMEAFGPESDAALSDKKIWQIIGFIRTLAQ